VAATDWDTIAKKEHLDQLSVEMRKVEGQIREIYAEMLQLQQREQEMRDLNGKQCNTEQHARAHKRNLSSAAILSVIVAEASKGCMKTHRHDRRCGYSSQFAYRSLDSQALHAVTPLTQSYP